MPINAYYRRRSAIEPVIGHMKTDGHLGRCHLKGREGDAANVVLSAVGHDLRIVLDWLRMLLRLILIALWRLLAVQSAIKSASDVPESSKASCLFPLMGAALLLGVPLLSLMQRWRPIPGHRPAGQVLRSIAGESGLPISTQFRDEKQKHHPHRIFAAQPRAFKKIRRDRIQNE